MTERFNLMGEHEEICDAYARQEQYEENYRFSGNLVKRYDPREVSITFKFKKHRITEALSSILKMMEGIKND